MKRYKLTAISCICAATLLASCSGMLMSTDFGIDDYGPSNSIYLPYGGFYNGPGYLGPVWNLTPPPPRPAPAFPSVRPPQVAPPTNGANRPNAAPPAQNRPQSPVPSQPSGTQRPGNMGQGPAQSQPSNQPLRGRN